MQWLYILLYAFYSNYYDYLCLLILMKKFLFSVNVCVLLKFLKLSFYLVLMYVYVLLWCFLLLKTGFLFGVNACVFITMILF